MAVTTVATTLISVVITAPSPQCILSLHRIGERRDTLSADNHGPGERRTYRAHVRRRSVGIRRGGSRPRRRSVTTVVHTADVHLRADAPERLEALEAVLDVAEDRDADVLTIGGDLFDRPDDVDELRSDLRNRLFSDRPFEIVLIPGNHDVAAFRGDLFFGDACTVVADEEHFGTWVDPSGSYKIVAIPYRETVTDDLLL